MLEALTVLFLASGLPTVASLVVALAARGVGLSAVWWLIRQLLEHDLLLSQSISTLNIFRLLLFDLLRKL